MSRPELAWGLAFVFSNKESNKQRYVVQSIPEGAAIDRQTHSEIEVGAKMPFPRFFQIDRFVADTSRTSTAISREEPTALHFPFVENAQQRGLAMERKIPKLIEETTSRLLRCLRRSLGDRYPHR